MLLNWPGSKRQLYALTSSRLHKRVWAEPFAGGGILGLKLLLNGKIDHLVINDIDPAVYQV